MPFDWTTALIVAGACLTILLPIIAKFAQGKAREAMSELVAAIPKLWLVIENERRRDAKAGVPTLATTSPLLRGEQLAKERFGPLTPAQKALVRQELQSVHEERHQWGVLATVPANLHATSA
jgi:hypothetical protein